MPARRKIWISAIHCAIFLFASAIFLLRSNKLCLFLPKTVFAALDIMAVSPSTIVSPDEIIKVTATVSGLLSNPHYLQIGLTLSGVTTNLFGITKNNGNEWYYYESSPTASDLTSTFYSFTHNDGSWFGEILGKIDINDSGYRGPGEYKLRLYKYTISSSQKVSSSHVEWASTLAVNVPLPPTPTPTLTPTPEPTSTPTPTPSPTPTPTKKPTPTIKPTPTPTGEVLGEEITPTPEPTEPPPEEKQPRNWLPFILIGSGLLLLGGSAVPFILPKLKRSDIIKKDEEIQKID